MRVVAIMVLSTAVLSIAPRRSKAGRVIFISSAIGAAMLLVLVDGPLARWLAMIIGVPSIASLALLSDVACARLFDRPLFYAIERRTLLVAMAALSLVLYPSALGYLNIDIYRLGFTFTAPLVLAAAGIVLAARRQFRLAGFVIAVLIALDVPLLPSANVFDYVVDPVGGLFAIGFVALNAGRRLVAAFQPA